jgi:hypothetical protein
VARNDTAGALEPARHASTDTPASTAALPSGLLATSMHAEHAANVVLAIDSPLVKPLAATPAPVNAHCANDDATGCKSCTLSENEHCDSVEVDSTVCSASPATSARLPDAETRAPCSDDDRARKAPPAPDDAVLFRSETFASVALARASWTAPPPVPAAFDRMVALVSASELPTTSSAPPPAEGARLPVKLLPLMEREPDEARTAPPKPANAVLFVNEVKAIEAVPPSTSTAPPPALPSATFVENVDADTVTCDVEYKAPPPSAALLLPTNDDCTARKSQPAQAIAPPCVEAELFTNVHEVTVGEVDGNAITPPPLEGV